MFTYAYKNGTLTTKTTLSYNTKISTSKFNEELIKAAKKRYSHPQGRLISLMKIYHVIMKYYEVYTDLNVVSIPTVPVELQARIDKITSGPTIEDRADVRIISSHIRQDFHLQ